VQIQATSSVVPCCVHTPIGRLSPDQPLAKLLSNDRIKDIRQSLLTGELDSECLACHHRTVVDIAQYRMDWARRFIMQGRALDKHGHIDLEKSPDLANRVDFVNTPKHLGGLSDRIFLHPQSPKEPTSSIRFFGLRAEENTLLDLYLYLDNEKASTITFTATFELESGERAHSVEVPFGQKHWCIPAPAGEFSLLCQSESAKPDYAWFNFTYPFFIAKPAVETAES
jgi:hypothetical protein